MFNQKNIFKILLLFTGVFLFKVPKEWEWSYTSQFTYLLLTSGLLGSFIIYQKNKYLGSLAGLCVLGTVKTLMLGQASKFYIFDHYLTGSMLFVSYYAIRELRFKEDMLKWLLVPAWLNIGCLFAQRALNYPVIGFLGNSGFTACLLGMLTPVFLKYCKWGIPFLLSAIILCDGTVGLIAGIFSALLYLYFVNKKIFKVSIVTGLVLFSIHILFTGRVNRKTEVMARISQTVNTLKGIKHHPFIGWGLGNFVSVFARRLPEDTKVMGTQCQYEGRVLNHPHNEFLFGWWNFGIAFPILCFFYGRSLIRKFTREKILSFSIISAGFVCMLGYLMTCPSWFVLFTSLAIYDNL